MKKGQFEEVISGKNFYATSKSQQIMPTLTRGA